MTAPAVFWPTLLGVLFLVAGIVAYRHDVHDTSPSQAFGLVVFGPAFVAAALAAFAGEHFTAAAGIASIVPKFVPGRLFIAYFVGVAHLAAATSFVARRYVRWSSLCLAVMFGLFVLLMDLPSAVAHPEAMTRWSLAARQATFAIGALALFVSATREDRSESMMGMMPVIRIWTACVLVFYGIEHIVRPDVTPGVPSTVLTASWVPLPLALAYATGALLIAFGLAMLTVKYAATGAAGAGLLMTALTALLYVPQFFLASDAGAHVTAINFIFDTLLFAGTMLVISRATSGVAATAIRATDAPVAKATVAFP